MSDKLPSIQFYPGDWKRDAGVQSLDFEARGIWFELLLLMWDSEERGKLSLNGRPMSEAEIAKMLGTDVGTVKQNLSKILANGVATVEQMSGKIINRRMVRDESLRLKKEHISQIRAEAGRFGGKQKASKILANSKQNHRASSSISSSSSASKEENINQETPLPESQSKPSVSSGCREWPEESRFVESFLKTQVLVNLSPDHQKALLNPEFWERTSEACGGIDLALLMAEFAKMGIWLTDNPSRRPTAKGIRRFVSGWLSRAYEKERRYAVQKAR